jgi:hypothetical protein
VGGAGVNIIAAVNVPIYLTIKDSQLIHTGKITALTTSEVVSGQPVNIFTTFQNTGNHHFKVKGEVTVSNAQGATLDTIDEALTASSIVPTMSRQLQATYIPNGELSSGVYSVKSKIMLEDGTLLDEASNTFEVTTQYVPPPAVGTIKLTPSSASTLTSADGKISIYFAQGSAVVPVEVSLQNYPADQVPALPQSLSLATTCFRVEGLTGLLAKEATVTVNYTAADLDKAGGDASRLRLARWDEGTNQWILLKTSVDTGAMTLSASSNQMSIGAVVVGGTGSSSPFGAINPWLVIGGAAGVVIIVLLVYFLVVRRRRA